MNELTAWMSGWLWKQSNETFKPKCASLVAQAVKRLSTMWETWARSLGWEDPLEKEMAIHSSTIAWKIPRTEEPDRVQSMGSQRVGHDWATSLTYRVDENQSPTTRQSLSHHNVGERCWSINYYRRAGMQNWETNIKSSGGWQNVLS